MLLRGISDPLPGGSRCTAPPGSLAQTWYCGARFPPRPALRLHDVTYGFAAQAQYTATPSNAKGCTVT